MLGGISLHSFLQKQAEQSEGISPLSFLGDLGVA